jgi:hypothetical protein
MRSWWLWACLAGCGASPPRDLAALPNKQLSLIVNFNPPATTPPLLPPVVLAFLQFDQLTVDCPMLDLTATLDGAMLSPSANLTGSSGNSCLVAFGLAPALPPAGTQSTLRIADDRGGVASYTTARLLDARAMTTTVVAGSVVHAGDVLTFTWPVDTDQIASVGATFVSGADQQEATTAFAGTTVSVTVPSLAPGSWTVHVDLTANPASTACTGAAQCGALVSGKTQLDVSAG